MARIGSFVEEQIRKIFTIGHKPVCVFKNGREFNFDATVLKSPDWVQVIPITEDNKIIMVEQHRFGTGEMYMEFPGGVVDPGEETTAAVLRELREETGYITSELVRLVKVDANPAFLTNSAYIYLARNCRKVGVPSLDESEQISLHEFTIPEVLGRNYEHAYTQFAQLALYRYMREQAEFFNLAFPSKK